MDRQRGLASLRTSRPAKLFTADGLATPEWSSLALSGESSMKLMDSCQPDTTHHAPFSITHWPIPSASRDSAPLCRPSTRRRCALFGRRLAQDCAKPDTIRAEIRGSI